MRQLALAVAAAVAAMATLSCSGGGEKPAPSASAVGLGDEIPHEGMGLTVDRVWVESTESRRVRLVADIATGGARLESMTQSDPRMAAAAIALTVHERPVAQRTHPAPGRDHVEFPHEDRGAYDDMPLHEGAPARLWNRGLVAALILNGVEIPRDELQRTPEIGLTEFTPAPDTAVEDLQTGRNCVNAVIWRLRDGRGVNDRSVPWCFEVV